MKGGKVYQYLFYLPGIGQNHQGLVRKFQMKIDIIFDKPDQHFGGVLSP